MSGQRKALDLGKLNDWVSNPESKKRLEEAKHQQLMIAMKKELAKSEKEAQFFSITEEEEEVTVALQKGLPSDDQLEEMKVIYAYRDSLEAALDAKDQEIRSLEDKVAKYHQMTLWERLVFLFTGRI